MAIKEIFSRARKKVFGGSDKSGGGTAVAEKDSGSGENVLVKPQPVGSNARSLEMIQNGLSDLVGQLDSINKNLAKQSEQNQQLMDRIEHLPDMIHTLPEAVKNQSASVKAMLKQMEDNKNNELEFIRAVESIPKETGKQTDELEKISGQLAAGAEVDVQFVESFNQFKQSIERMDNTNVTQNKTLEQMNKTFAASDRYMKFLMQKQAKKFTVLFIVALSVCLVSVVGLIAMVAYLMSKS